MPSKIKTSKTSKKTKSTVQNESEIDEKTVDVQLEVTTKDEIVPDGVVKTTVKKDVKVLDDEDTSSDAGSSSTQSTEDGVASFDDMTSLQQVEYMKRENRALIKILQQRQKQLLTIERTIKEEKRESKQKRKNKKPTSDNISIRQKSIVPKVITDFLGLDEGTEIAKRDLQKGICDHVREQSLQTPEDKTEFKLDDALAPLFIRLKKKGEKEYIDVSSEKVMSYKKIMQVMPYWFDKSVHQPDDAVEVSST